MRQSLKPLLVAAPVLLSGCVKQVDLAKWHTDLDSVRTEMRMGLEKLPSCTDMSDLNFEGDVTFNYPQNEASGFEIYPRAEYLIYSDPEGEVCVKATNYTFPRVGLVVLYTGSTIELVDFESTEVSEGPDIRTFHVEVNYTSSGEGEDFEQKLFVIDYDGDGAVDQISDTGDLCIKNMVVQEGDDMYGLSLSHFVDMYRENMIQLIMAAEEALTSEEPNFEIPPQEEGDRPMVHL